MDEDLRDEAARFLIASLCERRWRSLDGDKLIESGRRIRDFAKGRQPDARDRLRRRSLAAQAKAQGRRAAEDH